MIFFMSVADIFYQPSSNLNESLIKTLKMLMIKLNFKHIFQMKKGKKLRKFNKNKIKFRI